MQLPCFSSSLLCLLAVLHAGTTHAVELPVYHAELLHSFKTPNARQGVAVDARHFYVVDKRAISKHDKTSGEVVAQWPDTQENSNPLLHMDSLMEFEGRLYAAHSNYPKSPMTSSIEIWDADTMQHIGSHSLGVNRGSFTWLDRHDGFWWGGFANYDKVQLRQTQAYGHTDHTQVVKFDDHFVVIEAWILPQGILDRIRPMSNSGGSWGPDGYLYLTGHDHGEIYVMELPKAGSILHQVAMVKVPLMEGQGIAWDRSGSGRELWGINKKETRVARLKMPRIKAPLTLRLPKPAARTH